MKEKITARNYTIPKDLQGEILEFFWEKHINAKANRPTLVSFSCKGNMEKLLILIGQAKKTVCLQSEFLESPNVSTECVKAAQRGVRIYILLGRLPQIPIGLQPLVGKCLIRSGFKSIGSYILADAGFPQAKGYLFTHQLEENSLLLNIPDDGLPIHWMITLDAQQIKEFHVFFCHHFWNMTLDEILDTGDLGRPRKASRSPFGDIALPQEHYQSEQVLPILNAYLDKSICHASVFQVDNNFFSALSWNKFTQGMILTSVLGNEPKAISSIGEKVPIHACDGTNSLNCFLFQGNVGYVIPKAILSSKDSVYALRLNADQWDDAMAYLKHIAKTSGYEYMRKQKLQAIKSSIRFLDNPEIELRIQPSVSQSFGDIGLPEVADLQNLDTQKIIVQRTRSVRELLALEIQYSFTLHPPYLPGKARQDRIYEEWDSVQKEYQRYLDNIKATLEKIEERKYSLAGKVWEGLKSFFTGKTQFTNEEKEHLESLKKLILSQEIPLKREEVVKIVNEIADTVSQNYEEVEEEIEKQKARVAWDEKKQDLEKALAEKKEELAAKEKELEQFEAKYKEGLIAKEKEYAQAREYTAKELKIESNAWEEKQAQWEQDAEPGKDKETRKSAREKLEKMREIDDILSIWKNSQDIERNRRNSQIVSLRNKVEESENRLVMHGERFIYNSKGASSSSHSSLEGVMSVKTKREKDGNAKKSSFSSTYAPIFPKEELPKTGTLYQEGKERYLAIQYWEQLELAKKEADRLRAHLCVAKD